MTRLRESLSLWLIDMGLRVMPHKEVEELLRVSIHITTSAFLEEFEEKGDYNG